MPSDIYYKHTLSQPIRSGAAVGSTWAVLGSGINNDQAKLETDTNAFAINDTRHIEHILNLTNSGDVLVGADNTAISLVYNASGALRHYLGSVTFGYNATPTSGRMTISDGANVIHDEFVTSAGAQTRIFPEPKAMTSGNSMTITLTAGGASVKGSITVDERYLQ